MPINVFSNKKYLHPNVICITYLVWGWFKYFLYKETKNPFILIKEIESNFLQFQITVFNINIISNLIYVCDAKAAITPVISVTFRNNFNMLI